MSPKPPADHDHDPGDDSDRNGDGAGGRDDDHDQPTVVRPGVARAPAHAAAAAGRSAVQLGHVLPLGTRLRDYEITGLIGEGGFGIVYLAWDHSLQRKVAVKEYMPAAIAARLNGSSAIAVKSARHLDTFKAGLRSFVNEARLLARFDHPSLVKVYRFWEENGTAYMVMPFYEGPTLKTALAELGHVPNEDELRTWLGPLLDALAVMHAAQCFHRDIAPDNILLTAGGPLLLDFGAARRVIGDMTHALTVVLKPGYAPIEQYGEVATMAQGAWTDLYALACVVYYAITGRTPVSAVERLMDDRLEPLAVSVAGRYSAAFLRAIDAALAVRPQDRPQSEARFRALLDAGRDPSDSLSGVRFATVEHDPVPSTELRYETVPGTLSAELATQVQTRVVARPEAMPAAAARSGDATDPVPFATPTALSAEPLAGARGEAVRRTKDDGTSRAAARKARGSRRVFFFAAGACVVGVIAVALTAALWPATPGEKDATVAPIASPRDATPAPSKAGPGPSLDAAPVDAAPMAAVPVARPSPGTYEAASAVSTTSAASPASPASSPPETSSSSAAVPAPATLPEPLAPAATLRAPARPRREAAAPLRESVVAAPQPAPRSGAGARCSDILQKASLEPLTADEATYLKRECR